MDISTAPHDVASSVVHITCTQGTVDVNISAHCIDLTATAGSAAPRGHLRGGEPGGKYTFGMRHEAAASGGAGGSHWLAVPAVPASQGRWRSQVRHDYSRLSSTAVNDRPFFAVDSMTG